MPYLVFYNAIMDLTPGDNNGPAGVVSAIIGVACIARVVDYRHGDNNAVAVILAHHNGVEVDIMIVEP